MKKECNTCKYNYVQLTKEPCVSCRYGNNNVPTKWEAAEHYKPDTNADRIRAMSDEELADVVVCPHIGNWDLCRDDCKKCRLDWLKQPAEGADNG